MSVSGLCNVCGRGETTHVCDRCGAFVCERHYDHEAGLCTECAAELRRGRAGPEDDATPDDVDEYRL
jgi:hypothetical protein